MSHSPHMNIVIVGAGEIGLHMAQTLNDQDHNISVVESSERLAEELNDQLDARVLHGDGASVETLEEAGVSKADVVFSLTSSDHTNLLCASVAKSLGAVRTISRVSLALQREQWLFDYAGHFHVDYLFSPPRLAAVELAKSIRNPDCLLVEEIARGRIELQQLQLSPSSPAIGRPLRNLGLPPRIRIGAVQRRDTFLLPGADDTLEAGDLITIFGHPRRLADAIHLLQKGAGRAEEVNVVIFGGGDYGFALAQMLEGGAFRTRILERDARRSEQLSRMLQKATVLHTDGTSLRELREESVGEADFFVAATGEDEDNVMACLQARDLGVRQCLTLIHRADFADAVRRSSRQLGIVEAVSPRVAVSRDLARFVTTEKFTVLRSLPGGIDLISIVVPPDCQAAGRTVAEIRWPVASGLVALVHGSQAAVPAADDTIHLGDTVFALVSARSKPPFVALFS